MTSLSKRFGIGPGRGSDGAGLGVGRGAAQGARRAAGPRLRRDPPRFRRRTIFATGSTALGRAFDGRVGIAVVSLDDGLGDRLEERMRSIPQQSVSKLWVAITALDAVDRGQVSLDDQVTLGRADLTLFHQPIARDDPRRRLHDHARRPDVQGDHRPATIPPMTS